MSRLQLIDAPHEHKSPLSQFDSTFPEHIVSAFSVSVSFTKHRYYCQIRLSQHYLSMPVEAHRATRKLEDGNLNKNPFLSLTMAKNNKINALLC